MDFDAFLNLPTESIAALVRERGPKVCVFPINGTRRWLMLEHPARAEQDFISAYLEIAGQRHLDLYRLFFDHGIETLLTPVFGPDLLSRGAVYNALLEQGFTWFARDEFRAFYEAYDIRVRIYGDARRYLEGTVYAHALDAYEELERSTAGHRRHRLFFGICAHDAAETVAANSIRFYEQHGRSPTKREIVEAYYGEHVDPVDLFIGFDRPAAFDMPLIATGSEDLYFTLAPSLYVDTETLRGILYDQMVARRFDDSDYKELSPEEWQFLDEFYRLNRHRVLGVGRQHHSGRFWYPIPQVELPSGTDECLAAQ